MDTEGLFIEPSWQIVPGHKPVETTGTLRLVGFRPLCALDLDASLVARPFGLVPPTLTSSLQDIVKGVEHPADMWLSPLVWRSRLGRGQADSRCAAS